MTDLLSYERIPEEILMSEHTDATKLAQMVLIYGKLYATAIEGAVEQTKKGKEL